MKQWSTLKEISKSKITTSCAIWIFVVPAIAKISSFVGTHKYGGVNFEIVAPESLLLLYFSAISFFLGTLLYTVTCPPLIKLVDNFDEFDRLQMTAFNLSQSLGSFSKDDAKSVISLIRDKVGMTESKNIDKEEALLIEAGNNIDSIMVAPDKLRDCFWLIYETHKSQKVVAQFSVFGFYLIGFAILSYILISNLFIVLGIL